MKKVIENNGTYECANCSKTYDSCKPTFMARARVSDFTDSMYVTFAREHGDMLFGKTAQQFKELQESKSEEEVQAFIDTCLFSQWNLMVRCKYEIYNTEPSMKAFVIGMHPIKQRNLSDENSSLLKRLQIYSNLYQQDGQINSGSNMNDNQKNFTVGGDNEEMDGFM